MKDGVKPPAYPYHAARRAAATARTLEAIVAVGKDAFERRGWSGATMRGVPGQAGVSVKTAEAPCRSKAELLKQAVDYAIAGDLRLHRHPLPSAACRDGGRARCARHARPARQPRPLAHRQRRPQLVRLRSPGPEILPHHF